ncbi:MAG TPA: hypothetical protein VD884_22165 [Ohtaekwangia sp.]|nr:hypothetical protein [Ohtaekwangia sp.]
MKNVVYLLLLSFSFLSVEAQKRKKEADLLTHKKTWSEGSIMKSDGTELSGLINYDDKTNILFYREGDNSKSFIARSVLGFEFFDENLQRQRIFYSLEYDSEEEEVKRHYFFELLKDFNDFVVLSKKDPLEVRQVSSPVGYTGQANVPAHYSTETQVSQTETIYLMNAEGKIQPYLKNTHGAKTQSLVNSIKDPNTKIEDKETLADFVSTEAYTKLKEYAKNNNLKFQKIEDLLKILSYYETIRGK